MDNKTEYFDDDKPEDFKCDCVYPCDDYPECGGVRVNFPEPELEKCIKCPAVDGCKPGGCKYKSYFSKPSKKLDSVQWQDIMTTAAGIEPEKESQEELYDCLINIYHTYGQNKTSRNKILNKFTITHKNK